MDAYQQFIHKSRYARYLPNEQRRETWEETVGRYVGYWGDKIDDKERKDIYKSIHSLDVMPSMRSLMTAGEALDRDNVAGFNCSYMPIDHPKAFDEMMYVLMCGTGVGFSVERQYVSKLPEIAEELHETDTIINVADSKIGWAKAFRELVSLLYAGQIPNGMLVEYDLRVPRSRLLEAEQVAQSLCLSYSDSQSLPFDLQLAAGLAPLNVTISAVRLLKLSLSEEYDEAPSLDSAT